ncbi:hypothetical protein AGMMS49579_08350 [Spirochaetia bacterium]|nr:hypothetical protein AGMMS49579_08350 [Spirochaetia bacterium]
MKTVIMAGGRGTRISSIAADIPKPMIPIGGKPILAYAIEALVKAGLTDIIIVVGYLGDSITSCFKDGSELNARITYYTEAEPLGTAGALFEIREQLGESFILLNGDLIFDIDFTRLINFHTQKKSLATLVSHPNSHPYDSALLVSDDESRIIQWINKEDPRDYYKNRVSSGIYLLTAELLSICQNSLNKKKNDLDRDVLKPHLKSGRIFAYDTPEYIKDMGTPDRYHQVEGDIKCGIVSLRNLSHKQRAIFLDRDGTINVYRNFVTGPEDFFLIDGTGEAIRRINSNGYLAIVITNQPVIARGECSVEELNHIHEKMETELGKDGAYIDGLFYCPHHPDRGFPGERPEYKIDCDCRKPKPGLILRAAAKYNIDLSESWMAGDDLRDVLAGKAAGCKTALLASDTGLNGGKVTVQPDMICTGLLDFTEKLELFRNFSF